MVTKETAAQQAKLSDTHHGREHSNSKHHKSNRSHHTSSKYKVKPTTEVQHTHRAQSTQDDKRRADHTRHTKTEDKDNQQSIEKHSTYQARHGNRHSQQISRHHSSTDEADRGADRKASTSRPTHSQGGTGRRTTGKAQQQTSVKTEAGKVVSVDKAAKKALLSFGEEMEVEDAMGSDFSLANSTHRKFRKERRIEDIQPSASHAHTMLTAHDAGGISSSKKKCLGQMWFGVATTRGLRPYMEDRHTLVASYTPVGPSGGACPDGVNRSFVAIYDGHNGFRTAETCSNRLHMVLASQAALRDCSGDAPWQAKAEEGRMSAALHASFHAMDKEVLQQARGEERRDGATAVVILRTGEVLYAAHCGDSRAVLCRHGRAIRLTEDHKPNLAKERQRIQAAGGRVEFSKCWRVICEPRAGRPGTGLAVSRSFGDLDFKEPHRFVECEPDVRQVCLTDQDSFVVLASDGLWDVMTDQEATDSVQASLKESTSSWAQKSFSDLHAKSAADTLIVQALQKGTMDNVSAVVCLLPWQ